MTKEHLTILYNRLTAVTSDIEENYEAVDVMQLVSLLEETANVLAEIIEK